MGFDGKAFGEEIIAAVKAHIERKLAPILERLDRTDQSLNRLDQRIDAVTLRGVGPGIDENAIVARAVEALIPTIDERAQSAVAAIPAPTSVTVDDVRPLIETEVAAAVARLKRAEPASRSVSAMVINRKGALVATMDDGWMEHLGTVVEINDAFEFESRIAQGVRALPRPQTLEAA